MAKNTRPKRKLKITSNVIERLETKHEISNLLAPTGDDSEKMNTRDFLTDCYFEGSRKWDNPPSLEDIKEDVGLDEIAEAISEAFGSGKS
jgi:hypothetical protein